MKKIKNIIMLIKNWFKFLTGQKVQGVQGIESVVRAELEKTEIQNALSKQAFLRHNAKGLHNNRKRTNGRKFQVINPPLKHNSVNHISGKTIYSI